MPTTSYPSDLNSAAVTEESTPPDMATTTRVSCGGPSRSRLLRIVTRGQAALLPGQGAPATRPGGRRTTEMSERPPYYRERRRRRNDGPQGHGRCLPPPCAGEG